MLKTLILASAAALALASAASAGDISQQAITQAPVQQVIATPSAAATSSAGGSTSRSGDLNLTQDYRPAASTAWAAPLTFSQGTCYVSASGGGQSTLLGLSFAVPFRDGGCDARAMAQALYALGERDAAVRYLAAHDKGVAAALAGH